MNRQLARLVLLACVGLAACHPAAVATTPGASPAAPLAGTEWTLVELGGRAAPAGAGGRSATLTLADGRASGFAGCNQFGAGFVAADPALTFSAVISTRMACSAGMELERDYTAALEATRSYRLTSAGLELIGQGGVLARFARR